MRRIAAHWVLSQKIWDLSYLELDANQILLGLHPLREELASTVFYDGMLVPVPASEPPIREAAELIRRWRELTARVAIGDRVTVYRLFGIPRSAAELGASYGGSDGHIERL